MGFGSWASVCSSASLQDSRYDRAIEKAVDRWWPDFPFPNAWKAQLYQESLLETGAVSPVGARGIAQFMPKTWSEITRQLGWGTVSPHLAEPAIEAGAFYMAQLRSGWSSPRPELERQRLAQASYNAGFGNILRAQKRCSGARDWSAIAPCLSLITGRHARETIGYVDRIARWWAMLETSR